MTDQYWANLANNALAPVPDSCKEIENGVHALIQSIYDENALKGMTTVGNKPKVYENP